MSIYKQRVQELQKAMAKDGIDMYIVLSSDPHLSEYLPKYWKCREWLSGFSGSAGSLVITKNYAALFADGRYWIQAQKELQDSSIVLQKLDSNNTLTKWIESNLKQRQILATNFRVLPLFLHDELQNIAKKNNATLENKDYIDSMWKDRPTLPNAAIYTHAHSPHSIDSKLTKIREKMSEHKANYHIIASLDDIAWVCNLRGADVPYNPVFLSFLLISHSSCTLFVDRAKISKDIESILEKSNIKVSDYESVEKALLDIKDSTILYDSTKINASLASIAARHNAIVDSINPSQMLKACKSEKELEHIREAMAHDGAALCHFFAWLEKGLKDGAKISELDIAEKLTYFRSKSPLYISDSFATIAGFNANGARPHYSASEKEYSMIEGGGFLLIDSGGQYVYGTTDITRVVPIGSITKEQKRDYTLVLKANIALSSLVFPLDIPMPLLDSIARAPLWNEGINYMHGTGHGVGYFLNVHEGPQVISYFANPTSRMKAKVGMVSSIEPGIYREGKWGVRLENLVANVKSKESEFGEFLAFETLTLCPFETSCIDAELLSESEREWINSYHKRVREVLLSRVDGMAKEWLLERTGEI